MRIVKNRLTFKFSCYVVVCIAGEYEDNMFEFDETIKLGAIIRVIRVGKFGLEAVSKRVGDLYKVECLGVAREGYLGSGTVPFIPLSIYSDVSCDYTPLLNTCGDSLQSRIRHAYSTGLTLMERRNFLKTMVGGAFASVLMPGLLPQFMIRQYAAVPSLVWDPEKGAQITVVGVGWFGAKTAQLLARNVKNITCHEVVFNQQEQDIDRIEALFKSVRHSDLLFVVSGFDDRFCELFVTAITEAARTAGVLTVAVVPKPDHNELPSALFSKLNGPLFVLSDQSLTSLNSTVLQSASLKAAITGYVLRHLIATISVLITERGMICIDFADISAIFRSGGRGVLSTGNAAGLEKGRVATLQAVERLSDQGIRVSDCRGALVCLYGSSLMTMDDFDHAYSELHRHFDEDSNLILGSIVEEQMGSNIRVSIITTVLGDLHGSY